MDESKSAGNQQPTQRRQVPSIYATDFQARVSRESWAVLIGQRSFDLGNTNNADSTLGELEPLLMLNMSPQTGKNLYELLKLVLEKSDSLFGSGGSDSNDFPQTEPSQSRDSFDRLEPGDRTTAPLENEHLLEPAV